MDRKLTDPEQQPTATPPSSALTLAPTACGWTAQITGNPEGESDAQQAPTFAEALAAGLDRTAQSGASDTKKAPPVHIALPARLAIFERLTLPATDADELTGMVRLQFEKSLPYPLEETTIAFQILAQTAEPPRPNGEEDQTDAPTAQTTLLACGIHNPAATALCAPLLEQRRYPESLTLWAHHIAAQAPAGIIACGLWREEDQLLFGIFENRRLGYIEAITPAEDPLAALPRVLMSAEMAAAPLDFHTLLLDSSLASLAESLSAALVAPNIRELSLPGHCPELPSGDHLDLIPATWRAEQAQRQNNLRLRRQLTLAGALYCLLLLLALGYLGVQNARLNTLKAQAAALQPQVDTVLLQQSRWKALAPAIERQRFVLELLYQTFQSLPTPEARITQFDLGRNQFMIEGEMPDAQQAIAFGEQLKKRPELSGYRFESGQPLILPNEHAQFRIFGK